MASIKSLRLENLSADLDKHPGRWVKFQSDFSDMVRSMEHGDVLETFIDEVTGRNQYITEGLLPPFIAKNPDFAITRPPGAGGTAARSSGGDSSEGGLDSFLQDPTSIAPALVMKATSSSDESYQLW